MQVVITYAKREELEDFRKGDISFMQHDLLMLFEIILEGNLDGKVIFAVENIQGTAEGELFNRFTIEATRVLYNHHFFTKLWV